MLMLTFTQSELDLIVYALKRLEQDESKTAADMAEQASELLNRWDVRVAANEEEE